MKNDGYILRGFDRLEKRIARLYDDIELNKRLIAELYEYVAIRKTRNPLEWTEADIIVHLPEHLQKTYMTLRRLVEASAPEVCLYTKRARAVESGYLNQLVVMQMASKWREGRIVIFKLRPIKELETEVEQQEASQNPAGAH